MPLCRRSVAVFLFLFCRANRRGGRPWTSEAHLLLLFGIVAVARHGNGGDGILQLFPLVGGEVEVQRAQVLFEVREFGGPGDGYE